VSLTNKKSKSITIEGIKYRYQISTTKIDENWNFTLNLTIQRQETKGCVLQIKGLVTRDFWLDFSDIKINVKSEYPIILPKHIAKFVKKATSNGWESHKTGKPFNLEATNEVLLH